MTRASQELSSSLVQSLVVPFQSAWLKALAARLRGRGTPAPRHDSPTAQGGATLESAVGAGRGPSGGVRTIAGAQPEPQAGSPAVFAAISGGPMADEVALRLIHQSGGRQKPLIVLSCEPADAARDVCLRPFLRFGHELAEFCSLGDHALASLPNAFRAKIEQASCIVLAGADPQLAREFLRISGLTELLQRARQRGAVVAFWGTSTSLIVAGDRQASGLETTSPQPHSAALARVPDDRSFASSESDDGGLGWLQGMVIDADMARPGGLERLVQHVARIPHGLGLGLGAGTAAFVVDGRVLEVAGAGSLAVVDAGDLAWSAPSPPDGAPLQSDADRPSALAGIRLHLLPAGYRLNLVTRQPFRPELARVDRSLAV